MPKKAKLDSDYVFIIDSEEDGSLLFLSSGPGEPSGTSNDLSDSILFLSTLNDANTSMNSTLIPSSESEDGKASQQRMEAAALVKVCCDEKCILNFFKESGADIAR